MENEVNQVQENLEQTPNQETTNQVVENEVAAELVENISEEETVSKTEISETKEETTEEVVTTEKTVEEVENLTEEDVVNEAIEEELEEEIPDYENASKSELLSAVRELKDENDISRLDKYLKAIKPKYDQIYEEEKAVLLAKFLEVEGNEEDGFHYAGDEQDKEFFVLYGQLRTKRNNYIKELEAKKEENLKKKEALLVQIREILDNDESEESMKAIKGLQEEWKNVGQVPRQYNQTLWANYNALMDRYYDNRSIYYELKDLDRKKNAKLKAELCEKVEQLVQAEDVQAAVAQLNGLHEEYKNIGSVPREEQETLWNRFKTASDAIYEKRNELYEQLQAQREENLVKKQELITELQEFMSFDSDRIKEWNSKTKEIQDIQKKWEALGAVPRANTKEVNKDFWGNFKQFFNNKNQFFKKLEGQREENLAQKKELITKAEELKVSEDWNATAQSFKDLQLKWKEIGPVPEKVRNRIYLEFKAACDEFFEKKRAANDKDYKEQEENLNAKLEICNQLEAISGSDSLDIEQVYQLVDDFNEIGFVPRNAIKKSKSRYEEVTQKILENDLINHSAKINLQNHIQVGSLRNTPGGERKLQKKENAIRRSISNLENDINTWKTNMEFFANSATADKLKADMQQKIVDAEQQIDGLKQQLATFSE